jgi:hypothetical protein
MMRGYIFLCALTGFAFFFASCKDDEPNVKSLVAINELMASNSNTAADQDGEYDDWVELYNMGSTGYDLSGHFLTDNHKNKTKWQFPGGTSIGSKGFLIVWCDGDTLQTGLHANFRLSATGEELLLVSPDGAVLDEVYFGPQVTDRSYARVPDGTGPFSIQPPTFNGANSAP